MTPDPSYVTSIIGSEKENEKIEENTRGEQNKMPIAMSARATNENLQASTPDYLFAVQKRTWGTKEK